MARKRSRRHSGSTQCGTRLELQALIDGGLSGNSARRLSEHIESCVDCQGVLDSITENVDLPISKLATAVQVPDDADDLLQGKIAEVLAETQNATPADAARENTVDADRPPDGSLDDGIRLCHSEYELLEKLGSGGMGVVYRARDVKLDRVVAIKFLSGHADDTEAHRHLIREARAAATVDHPNVVTIHDVRDDGGGRPFLVMQFVDGVTLQQRISADGPLPGRAAAKLFVQVANALAAAHQRAIVHRDVKASNIIIEQGSECAKVTDFGLALSPESTGRTWQNILPGTPEYMSPEQLTSDVPTDSRADIYSLGVTLYHTLTGTTPFDGPASSVIKRILGEEPRPPRKLNPNIHIDLETVCLKAMRKQPADRYQTAIALRDDLNRFLRGEPILARRASRLRRTVSWFRRRPERIAAAVLLICCLGGVAASAIWNQAQTRVHRAQLDQTQQQLQDTTVQLSVAQQTTSELRDEATELRDEATELRDEVDEKEAEKLQPVMELILRQQSVPDGSARGVVGLIFNSLRPGLKQQIDRMEARNDPTEAYQLALYRRGYADLARKTGDDPAALESLRVADELFTQLDPAVVECSMDELLKQRANCKRDLAWLLTQADRADEAVALHRDAEQLYGELLAHKVGAVHLKLERLRNQIGLTAAALWSGDEMSSHESLDQQLDEIGRTAQRARKIWLVNAEPIVRTYHEFAQAAAGTGQSDLAERALRKSYDFTLQSLQNNPSPGNLNQLGYSFHQLAETFYAHSQQQLAVVALELAILLYEQCRDALPAAADAQRQPYNQLIEEAKLQLEEMAAQ